MSLKYLRAILFFAAISIVASPFAFAESNSSNIRLHFSNKVFDPVKEDATSEEVGQDSVPIMQTMRLASDSPEYYILQFDGPIKKEWKTNLILKGVTFFNYVPDFAFIIKAMPSLQEEIKAAVHVRWLGEYTPDLKMSKNVYLASKDEQRENGGKLKLLVAAFAGENMDGLEASLKNIRAEVLSSFENSWGIKIKILIDPENVEEIIQINGVQWVEPVRKKSLFNNAATDILQVRELRNTDPLKTSKLGLFGEGQIVGVCDSGLDTNNKATVVDDFKAAGDIGDSSRIVDIVNCFTNKTAFGYGDTNGHGTHVAGSVLGNGRMSGSAPLTNTYPDDSYTGIAPEAKLYFQATDDFEVELATIFQEAYDKDVRIHSNSWGTSRCYYSISSQDIDQFSWDYKDFLILFAASNDGLDLDQDGVIDLYSLSTEATAKNSISVGASEDLHLDSSIYARSYTSPIYEDEMSNNPMGLAAFSSRGPTLDGRFKPEVVAPGTDVMSVYSTKSADYTDEHYLSESGTSMATPLTAGACALLREYLIKKENFSNPSAALVKATLLNGAVDISPGQYGTEEYQETQKRPDFAQGFGRVNVAGSINAEEDFEHLYYDITTDAPADSDYKKELLFDVTDNGGKFATTMTWTDYPGAPLSEGKLVNDLDLRIKSPSGEWIYPDNAQSVTILQKSSFGEDANLWGNPEFGFGAVFTPTDYPCTLSIVSFTLASSSTAFPVIGAGTICVYKYSEGQISDETIYRQKIIRNVSKSDPFYLNWPVDIPISSDSVFVAFMPAANIGVFYDNAFASGTYYNNKGLGWEEATIGNPVDPAISATFTTGKNSSLFDRVNNSLSITIDNAEIGTYTAEVTAYNIPQGPQPYALVLGGVGGIVPDTGSDSVTINPGQPNAPTVVIGNKERVAQSAATIRQNTGAVLDDPVADVVSFECTITAGANDTQPVSFRYAASNLPVVAAGSLKLNKILSSGQTLVFKYPEVKTYTDGNWWLEDLAGDFLGPNTILSSATKYFVVSVVKDNGDFDLNKTLLQVEDPQVLTYSAPSSSSGSGGCVLSSKGNGDMLLLLLFCSVVGLLRGRSL